jgi:Tol biopolymer transport system component
MDLGPSKGRRVGIALVALLIALAGLTFAVEAFRAAPQGAMTPTLNVTNGKIAFARYFDRGWQIDTINPDGTAKVTLTNVPGQAFDPAWSPDGHRLLFDMHAGGDSVQIFVVNDDGTGLSQLTDGPGSNYMPAWSSDGSRIAFVSSRDGNDEIYVMNAGGTAQSRLTDSPNEDLTPSWAPAGDRIAFQSNRGGNNEIYVMKVDGTDVTRLTDQPGAFEGAPDWSPDGERIVFASDRDGAGVYTMHPDGTEVVQLTHDKQVGPLDPSWSPDGTSIVYTTSVEGANEAGLFVVDATTGSSSALPSAVGDVGGICCPSWQPVIGQSPEVSEAPSSLVGEARVTATIPLPEGTVGGGVAVGSGAAWVGFQSMKGDPEPGVARIDLATNQVVATIAVDGTPWRDLIVATDQGVWVGSDGVIDRIDSATNSVVAAITVGGSVSAMDADPSAIWAVVEPSGASSQNAELVRVDTTTDEIVATIPLGDAVSGYEDQVVSSDGSVWIMGRTLRSNDTELGGDLVQVDATTNAVVSRFTRRRLRHGGWRRAGLDQRTERGRLRQHRRPLGVAYGRHRHRQRVEAIPIRVQRTLIDHARPALVGRLRCDPLSHPGHELRSADPGDHHSFGSDRSASLY